MNEIFYIKNKLSFTILQALVQKKWAVTQINRHAGNRYSLTLKIYFNENKYIEVSQLIINTSSLTISTFFMNKSTEIYDHKAIYRLNYRLLL